MSYETFKYQKDELNAMVDTLTAKLNEKYPTEAGVLVSEEIRMGAEYIADTNEFRAAFNKLRAFNQAAPKEYKRRAARRR